MLVMLPENESVDSSKDDCKFGVGEFAEVNDVELAADGSRQGEDGGGASCG